MLWLRLGTAYGFNKSVRISVITIVIVYKASEFKLGGIKFGEYNMSFC